MWHMTAISWNLKENRKTFQKKLKKKRKTKEEHFIKKKNNVFNSKTHTQKYVGQGNGEIPNKTLQTVTVFLVIFVLFF